MSVLIYHLFITPKMDIASSAIAFFRKYLIVFVLLLISYTTVSQVSRERMDSLEQVLSLQHAAGNRLPILFKLGESHWFNRSLPKAIYYFRQTIELGEQSGDYRYHCNAQLLLGHVYMRMQRFDSALNLIQQSLSCSERFKQTEHIPKAYQGLGMVYNHLGDAVKAVDYLLQAADGYEKDHREEINEQSIFAWLETGYIFQNQRQWDKALFYHEKALQKARATGKEYLIKSPMIAVANIHLKKNELSTAKKIFEEVLLLDRKVKGAEPTMDALTGLGIIAIREKKYARAIKQFAAALDTSINRNFLVSSDGFANNLGYAYYLNGQPDSAIRYYSFALSKAIEQNDLVVQKGVYLHMAELKSSLGKSADAAIFLQKAVGITDSIYNMEKNRSVNNLEILYQTGKKEIQINELKLSNAKKELAVLKRNRLLVIGGITAISLLIVFSMLLRNLRHKKLLVEKEQKVKQQQIEFLLQQQQVVALQSMINGQEAERTRIAKDLHDGLGGLFSTIKMLFSTLRHERAELEGDPLFNKSYDMVNSASEEVRRIAHNMMPEVLIKLGLIQAVQDLCNSINAGKLLTVSMQAYGMDKRLNASTEIMLFRIIQELLNNIIKHAQATQAIIQFNREANRLSITVEDNGRGFNLQETDDKTHAGLSSVQNRVAYLNGKLSIDSQNEVGTTVMMDFLINETW